MLSVSVVENSRNLSAIERDVIQTADRAASNAVAKAIEPVPAMIRETFDRSGARGGAPEWPRVHFLTLKEYRRTWPENAPGPVQTAYWRAHRPLIDTGNLRKSFAVEHVNVSGPAKAATVTGADYGRKHNTGGMFSSVTRAGERRNIEIRRREHMFLTEDDQGRLDEIADGAFKGAFSGQAP